MNMMVPFFGAPEDQVNREIAGEMIEALHGALDETEPKSDAYYSISEALGCATLLHRRLFGVG